MRPPCAPPTARRDGLGPFTPTALPGLDPAVPLPHFVLRGTLRRLKPAAARCSSQARAEVRLYVAIALLLLMDEENTGGRSSFSRGTRTAPQTPCPGGLDRHREQRLEGNRESGRQAGSEDRGRRRLVAGD